MMMMMMRGMRRRRSHHNEDMTGYTASQITALSCSKRQENKTEITVPERIEDRKD